MLNIILSFYLVLLSCLPCADLETDTIVKTGHEIGATHEDHSENHTTDLCSPFCVCNCCGQQTFTSFQAVTYFIPVKFEVIKTSTPLYTAPIYSNHFGSIWQPPQIA
ncbi:DUF6660 family protein [Flavobacterium sp.]